MGYRKKDGTLTIPLDDGRVVSLQHGGFGLIFGVQEPWEVEGEVDGATQLVATWIETFDGPPHTPQDQVIEALCSAIYKLYPELEETE